MKLYVYDHCPFCVRARMIFGLKNQAVELITLPYDDEKTPADLVGKKMLPILVKEDGSAMPESLEIVHYVDAFYGEKSLSPTVRPEIEAWMKNVGSYYNNLLIPRFVRLRLGEYTTQSAVDYFVKKKSEHFGDFAELFAQSPQYLTCLQQDLLELSPLILCAESAAEQLSEEDILLFPMLRNLTCVKGVVFPENVLNYIQTMANLSQVALYFDQAI
ncbi:glutaredoxin, GrxB family [Actinobacillus seminis]|uniref:Glutaredoxin n=1 Tax=Actinobacillus seminis TaxID=722 RepID=A0A263HA69_9PAST|nr:glutaredoxin 2 [Actinobacillus seminis]OZN24365.1 glutaredoxin, GrxB family [Actinobacillus seminis]SUU37222.1 glutaredoxin [Actinobacillus seminis]